MRTSQNKGLGPENFPLPGFPKRIKPRRLLLFLSSSLAACLSPRAGDALAHVFIHFCCVFPRFIRLGVFFLSLSSSPFWLTFFLVLRMIRTSSMFFYVCFSSGFVLLNFLSAREEKLISLVDALARRDHAVEFVKGENVFCRERGESIRAAKDMWYVIYLQWEAC